ncbi:MAG: alpha/beta fold hydrolase [Frankiaceae bacterium]
MTSRTVISMVGTPHRKGAASRSRLGLIGLAGLLAVSLVATGCGASTTDPSVAGPSTGSGAATSAPTSRPITRASYVAAPCPQPNVPGAPSMDLGPNVSCGHLTVPENRNSTDGKTIRIAVARLTATAQNPRHDPIVFLMGGPGHSALARINEVAAQGLNRDRDVIFIDQRGTGHSEPLLGCAAYDKIQRESVQVGAENPKIVAGRNAALRACHDGYVAAGWDLTSYNTPENAADVADLRVALGIPEWNVYGVSYGTDLGLQLLRDHPEGIRSVVLDGAVPPQLNLLDNFWAAAAAGWRAVFDACTAQPACHQAYPDLEAEFTAAANRLAAHPVTVPVSLPSTGQTVPVVVDGYALANFIVAASSPGSPFYPALPALIHQVASGELSAPAMAVLSTMSGEPTMDGRANSYGLQLGVLCREQWPYTSPAQMLSNARKALPQLSDAVLDRPANDPGVLDCPSWNAGRADPAVHRPAVSSLPVLFVSGTWDGITPPVWAHEATSTLPNSRVLEFPGSGHGTILWTKCANTVVANFYDRPAGGYDASCIAGEKVPTFTTQ